MPSIRSCLEYKHPYVRRNAVLAVFTIYQHCDSLIPDAPDLVLRFLEQEGDPSCKRNAFLMLLHVDERKALDYLAACQEQVAMFGDIMQLVVVELIYKVPTAVIHTSSYHDFSRAFRSRSLRDGSLTNKACIAVFVRSFGSFNIRLKNPKLQPVPTHFPLEALHLVVG